MADVALPFSQLRDSGLLWLINRVVFHPRGFALALVADEEGVITGWTLQGDGSEPWSFSADRDNELFEHAERTLQGAAIVNAARSREGG